MNILSIVGARPQFIKAAMFAHAVEKAREDGHDISTDMLHTGQHFDHNMSEAFFEELGIPEPVANLEINGGTHAEMTGAMLPAIEKEILLRKPDMLMVFGDTNSTIAGALAAAKLNVPIAHIEAGMRHYKRDIPEEINRIVTDALCKYLFCSSAVSQKNLAKEGITKGVHVVGDITYDVFCHYHKEAIPQNHSGEYVACTIHRAANTDCEKRLGNIIDGMSRCPHKIVVPLHPRTRIAMDRYSLSMPSNVVTIDPLNYREMLGLVKDSQFVLTDSGGLQKDAFFCGKRVITMSEVSPWQELLDLNFNRLVGANPDAIEDAYGWASQEAATTEKPYGNGDSANRIVDILLQDK